MNFSSKTLMALLSATFLFASCQKEVSVKEQITSVNSETSNNAIAVSEFPTCKLRRIYQSYGYGAGDTINGLFTYNSAGNPVSALFKPAGEGNHYFYYDKQNRLIKYDAYGIYFGDESHYYTYDASNRIVIDSLYEGKGGIFEKDYVIKITYDSQGRIIKENIKNYFIARGDEETQPPLEKERNPTYTYDSRGNLGVSGWKSSSYDNKVSIYRSHPIFQFIHRNYSRNNSSVQSKYNSLGLPLTVVPGNDYFFNLKNVTKAIYDCN